MFHKKSKMKYKDLGIVAVSSDEKFWIDNKERCLRAIKEHEDVLKLENAMLETIERKLKECTSTQ
jgi:hypothetical protein